MPIRCERLLVKGLALFTLLWIPTGGRAEDTVRLRSSGDRAGTVEIVGEVVDFSGSQIVVSRAGREQSYDGERVIEIVTSWPPGFDEGNEALASGDYRAAIAELTRAAQGDSRVWVRRLVMERMMSAYAAQGDWLRAGDLFVSIAASDPHTPALKSPPLAWHAVEGVPHGRTEQWLRDASPAAQLLGASHALPGPLRGEAIEVLDRLSRSDNPRIALLAQAQLWRTKLVTAGLSEVGQWEGVLKRTKTPVGGGPWLVVGDAYAHRGEHDRAALAWLHVAIDFPDQHATAARGLLMAARITGESGHPDEQRKLLHDLTSRYPGTPPAQEGAGMLQSLAPTGTTPPRN